MIDLQKSCKRSIPIYPSPTSPSYINNHRPFIKTKKLTHSRQFFTLAPTIYDHNNQRSLWQLYQTAVHLPKVLHCFPFIIWTCASHGPPSCVGPLPFRSVTLLLTASTSLTPSTSPHPGHTLLPHLHGLDPKQVSSCRLSRTILVKAAPPVSHLTQFCFLMAFAIICSYLVSYVCLLAFSQTPWCKQRPFRPVSNTEPTVIQYLLYEWII